MKRARMWLEDLKSGKNAEVYIVLAVVTAVTVLGLIGVIEQKLVTSAILMVLALLAFSILNTRHDLSHLNEVLPRLQQIEGSALGFLKNRSQVGTISELVAEARHIDLSVIAGTFIVEDPQPLEERLECGARIRLLLVSPCDDEHTCTLVSRCDPMTEGHTDELQRDVRRAVRKLVALQKRMKEKNCPGSLEIRFQTIVPPFGIFAIDPDSPKGVIKVEIYPYRTPIVSRPHFFLKRDRDGEWYEIFREQFEKQWNIAVSFDSINNCESFSWGDLTDV